MNFVINDVSKLIAFGVAMLAISVIAIISAINTGNGEHWIQVVLASGMTLATAFGIIKTIKNNGENSEK